MYVRDVLCIRCIEIIISVESVLFPAGYIRPCVRQSLVSVHDGAVHLTRHRHKRLLRLVLEEEFTPDHLWVESLLHQLTFDLFEGPRHVQLVLRRSR